MAVIHHSFIETPGPYPLLKSVNEEQALNLTGSCSFNSGDLCGYTTSSTTSLFGWGLVAIDNINEFVSENADQEGIMKISFRVYKVFYYT